MNRRSFLVALAFSLALPALGLGTLWANSPRPPSDAEKALVRDDVLVLREVPQGLDTPASPDEAAPARGVNNCVVLLVQYSGQTGTKTATQFNNMLFTTSSYPTGSMNDYYREVSYGIFGVTGNTYPTANPWYTAFQNEAYYVNGNGGMTDSYPQNSQGLVREAVILADATVNFANYDNDGDGYVDNVFVVFPGYAAEAYVPPNYNEMWSHKWALSGGVNGPGSYLTNDGVRVNLYTVTPELRGTSGTNISSIGVYCHEYGHILGLPDLYDTKPSSWVPLYDKSEGLGNYCLMAGGSWGADGNSPDRPSHPCGWAKNHLGWIGNLVNIPNDVTGLWLLRVEDNDEIYRVWNGGSAESEYFLLENRQKYGFDGNFPNSGLLIYHVDESIMNGDYDSDGITNWYDNALQWDEVHKFIDVECADQTLVDHLRNADHLDARTNRGDGNDFFRSGNKTVFDNGSRPSTVSYSGNPTQVAVRNISASGSPMTADISVGAPPGGGFDIWIKDCAADNGSVPSSGNCPAWWTSTDIWIDNDKDGLQDAPVVGQTNQLYARVRNAGPNAASNVTLNLYYRDNTTGLSFPTGATFIGTKSISLISSGATVSKWVAWTIPNPPTTGGHWCIGAVASATGDVPNGAAPPSDNNVGGVNIGVLYSRQGTPPLIAADSTGIPEPVEADFLFANPTTTPNTFVLTCENALPSDWQLQFFLEGVPLPIPWFRTLGPLQQLRISVQAVPPPTVLHGTGGMFRVVQYYAWGFPGNPEAVTGGIDFPCTVDLYRPAPVDDLHWAVVLDQVNIPPETRPMILVQWSPVLTDTEGNPENVAYYSIYRDVTPDFVPSPANLAGSIAIDIDTVTPGFQWYDEGAVVVPPAEPNYYYIVQVHDEAGYESDDSNVAGPSGLETDDGPRLSEPVTLGPGWPNPFRDRTEIHYGLARRGPVTLSVLDVLGRRVTTLVDGVQGSGPRMVRWDGTDSGGAPVGAGVYFCRIESAGAIRTGRLVLVR